MKNAFIAWDHVFTDDELDAIIGAGDALVQQKAVVAIPSAGDEALRITKIAWMDRNTGPFYERIVQVVRQLNSQVYHFDITGLEHLQYTVYHGNEGGHYDWHMDYGPHNPRPRKLSLSIQLTDPAAYADCDLQFRVGNKVGTAPRRHHRLSVLRSAPGDADQRGHAQGAGGLGHRAGFSLSVTAQRRPGRAKRWTASPRLSIKLRVSRI